MAQKIKLFHFALAILLFTNCSSDKNRSRIPDPETVKTLMKVRSGFGQECLDFSAGYGVRHENGTYEEVTLLNLELDEEGRQIYRFSQAEIDNARIDLSETLNQFSLGELGDRPLEVVVRALLFEKFRNYFNQAVDHFMGGFIADGSIQKKTILVRSPVPMLFDDLEIPYEYSVDCFEQTTSYHIRFDEWAMRWVHTLNEDGSLSVSVREINESRDAVITENGTLYPIDQLEREGVDQELEDYLGRPEPYRELMNKSITIKIKNLDSNSRRDPLVFAALKNTRTKEIKVFDQGMSLLSSGSRASQTFEIPLRFFNSHQRYTSGRWQLIVGATYSKRGFGRGDFYFPLSGNAEVITARSLDHRIINEVAMDLCITSYICEQASQGFPKELRFEGNRKVPSFDMSVELTPFRPTQQNNACLSRESDCFTYEGQL
jgi:hypothetical protein